MEEQIKKAFASLKEFWDKQTKAKKRTIGFSAAGILALAIGLTVFLNAQGGAYVTMYSNLDKQEAASVYNVLQDMAVTAQMDSAGNVLVPRSQVDTLRLELAGKGYPKTGLSYDIFSNVNGLTTTESDRKVYLTQQLQENMQQTLIRIEGVHKAVVILNLASDSNFVWEQETQGSTASVLLTLDPGLEMSKKQVAAIKNLIATGAPKLKAGSVTVVDAATSMELTGETVGLDSLAGELERVGFERQIEKTLEDKARNQLSLFYNADQLRVGATVVINYDKMISESMQYKPEQGNTGTPESLQEQYAMNPNSLASGIPGENDNTDEVPVYVDQDGDGIPEYIDYTRSVDYAISYIKSQVEKGKAELTSASIAIMIKDSDLNQQKRDSIIEQISKATNIPAGSISVETLTVAEVKKEVDAEPGILEDPVLLAVIGLGAFSLLIIIFLVARMLRKRKKGKLSTEEVDELALQQQRMQHEMDEKKRMLRDAADAKAREENAIATEVRTFAKENPEITASLIRSWLKEDD